MVMNLNSQSLFKKIIDNWLLSLSVSLIVLILLVLGLLLRNPYIAEVKIDIGGIITEDNGREKFIPFDNANQVEDFFSHYVYVNPPFNAQNNCSAKAAYSPNGPSLRIICRGRDKSKIFEMIQLSLNPLVERHNYYYKLEKNRYDQKLNFLVREIREREKIINLMGRAPSNAFTQSKIIEEQLNIEQLREKIVFEELLGNRVRPTLFDESKISLINRQPSITVWILVLLVSILSGLFVAFFWSRFKQIEC